MTKKKIFKSIIKNWFFFWKICQETIINIFNLIKDLNKIEDELKNQKDFTIYETFIEIVKDEKYITKEKVFLEDNNIELDDNDLDILLFRIDADNDDQITY